jgi:prepilin-type N-terminal cleavage/methylation domain-containing protein
MERGIDVPNKRYFCSRGFSQMELLVVIAVLGIVLSLAAPAAGTWIESLAYRQTARDLLSILRDARSRAITLNREHRMEFDDDQNRFRLLQGNRGTDSNQWDTVVYDWTSPPHPVRIASNIAYIHLNTNGTANGGMISVKEGTARTRYDVRISRTGRFRIISR